MHIYLKENWLGFAASQLLGDGHLRGNIIHWRHENHQRDYVLWKGQISQSLGLDTKIKLDIPCTSQFGAYFISHGHCKIPTKELKGKAPENLVGYLNALGLLLWWLDDGCISVHHKKNGISVSRFGYLGTEQFDFESNQRIADALFRRFGLSSRIHIDKGGIRGQNMVYYRLYFNATTMRALIDIIRPLIPSIPRCMLYKIHMGYFPTRMNNSHEYSERYNFV